MKRKHSTRGLGTSTVDNIPNRRCLPPVIVKRTIDFSSTLPFYDENGVPKRFAPSHQNDCGEWLYCLSPFKDSPPLSGLMLVLHLQAVKQAKLPKEEEFV